MPKKILYIVIVLIILAGITWVIGQSQQAQSAGAAVKQTAAAELAQFTVTP